VRGQTRQTVNRRRVSGWSLVVAELRPDETVPPPTSVTTSKGFVVGAPGPVRGQPSQPVEWGGESVPSRVHAVWTRQDDGLVVEMVVNTTTEAGPVAEWFLVRPPQGVTGDANDYRLPVLTMAKLAVTEWGYEATGLDIYDLGQEHLRDEEKQQQRLALVARCDSEAAEQGRDVWEYTQEQLVRQGFKKLSRSRIYSLRSEARAAGLLERNET